MYQNLCGMQCKSLLTSIPNMTEFRDTIPRIPAFGQRCGEKGQQTAAKTNIMNYVYIMMGVSGSGKTTVGIALADKLNIPFYDADDYHPPENIAKMSSGIPLNDDDRAPWLDRLHAIIADHIMAGTSAVLTCSALKQTYRERLRGDFEMVQFVFLDGTFDLIWERMSARKGHYMKAEMLQSQFDTLDRPNEAEAMTLSVALSPNEIMERITLVRNKKWD